MFRARCPACGVELECEDLRALTKHTSSCRAKSNKRKPAQLLTPPPVRSLPVLPVILHCQRPVLSQNSYKANSHWLYVKDAKGWLNHLEPLVLGAKLNGLELGYSEWSIVRVYSAPKREFDWGNLVGGAKPIPDALKRLGVICDDSPAHFKCSYEQICGDGQQTILTLHNGTL